MGSWCDLDNTPSDKPDLCRSDRSTRALGERRALLESEEFAVCILRFGFTPGLALLLLLSPQDLPAQPFDGLSAAIEQGQFGYSIELS